MKATSIFAAALAASLAATPAFAGDSYKFHLYNKSTQYTITGFETYEKGEWSTCSNVGLAPGDDQVMDWNSNEGSCVVPFRIVYKETKTEQYKVDWCKVKNIYVSDTDVTYD